LDRSKNPFLQRADLELFLARLNGRIVGRIAAVNAPQYNQFHNTEDGVFGLFERIHHSRAVFALLVDAAELVRGRARTQLLGLVNLSFNHDCGVLVEGFEHPPAMMMPYNPPYYSALLEASGFKKAKDLWSYVLSTSVAPPEKVVRVAEKIREQEGIRIRPIE